MTQSIRSAVVYVACAAALALSGFACRQAQKDDTPTVKTVSSAASLDNATLARAEGVAIPTVGRPEPAALFLGPMPTGVAISKSNRMFVNFPRWGDPVEYTVAEVRDGKTVPFPNRAINKLDPARARENFVSVQSVYVDGQDRLWVLDTGSINFQPVKPGGPKLIGYDLNTNKEVKRIEFPPDVAKSVSYLNDVRFDLKRGKEGMAFITDSSARGENGIVVVDLASGNSWRRLDKHPSTLPEPQFVPTIEGKPFMAREPGQPEAYVTIGSDGIAITPDGKTLYYCPLMGHHLYSVSVDALADRNLTDEQVAATVKDLGDRGFASDGLECDHRGRLYLTDYENNAIRRRTADGKYEIIAQDPRMLWPDSMAFGPDGALYFTANQLHRQKAYNNGKDLRKQPYVVFRVFPEGGATPTARVAGARNEGNR
jgi:sugar lactone lactonase YvrE